MRITADLGKCLAYANCVAAAPDIYDLTGTVVTVLEPNPPADRQDAARSGARQCPAKALTVEDDA